MNKTETIPVYDSAQRGFPALEELKELLKYRNLVNQMVRRDIVMRYKRSFLGVAWTMLNPLMTTLIMAIVFSRVFGGRTGYAGYIICGLMAWNFHSQATIGAMTGIIWGGQLLQRIYLPRTIFAVTAIGTGLINLGLSIVPLIIVVMISGLTIKPTIVLLPIPILFLAVFALGVGLILSTIAVHFPDIAEMYGIVLTIWLYLSPVIWTIELIPERFRWVIYLNPMYYLINLFRVPIYDGRIPTLEELSVAGGISLITLLIGWVVFAQKSDEFAYRA